MPTTMRCKYDWRRIPLNKFMLTPKESWILRKAR